MDANDFPPEFLTEPKTGRGTASAADRSLLLRNEVYQIVGCAMEVLTDWGTAFMRNLMGRTPSSGC